LQFSAQLLLLNFSGGVARWVANMVFVWFHTFHFPHSSGGDKQLALALIDKQT